MVIFHNMDAMRKQQGKWEPRMLQMQIRGREAAPTLQRCGGTMGIWMNGWLGDWRSGADAESRRGGRSRALSALTYRLPITTALCIRRFNVGAGSTRRLLQSAAPCFFRGERSNGGTGIRTLESLATLSVFKTDAFDHSAIPPGWPVDCTLYNSQSASACQTLRAPYA